MKLIYIGGYGHSGSTLLEYLMTGCPELIGCGEVVNARRERARVKKCSCRRRAGECPVWNFVCDSSLNVDRWSHDALDKRLLEQAAGRYDAIVDSSKTAWGDAATPFKLHRELGRDFRLVHIVRDPRAVCWSLLTRQERVGAQANKTLLSVKTALAWYYANLACELIRQKCPDQYFCVRYEDLARDPREVMASLMRDLSRRWDFDAIGAQDNRHQLYANRMRSRDLSLENIKVDEKWRTDMPRQFRRLVGLISWPLRVRYGYL